MRSVSAHCVTRVRARRQYLTVSVVQHYNSQSTEKQSAKSSLRTEVSLPSAALCSACGSDLTPFLQTLKQNRGKLAPVVLFNARASLDVSNRSSSIDSCSHCGSGVKRMIQLP